MALGLLQPGGAQYYQASGEATPQAEMPEKFKAMNVAPSPLSDSMQVPPEWMPDIKRAPVVRRVPRLGGFRTLYSRAMQRQPYERLGQPGGNPQKPYVSAFNPNDMGPIRNGHFYDRLYQAGYPGFNLGTSFKVQRIVGPADGRRNAGLSQGGPQTVSGNRKVNKLSRSSGAPPNYS